MSDIHLEGVDESTVRIKTNPGILRELSDAFSFRVKNYFHMPKYKAGMWDGYIRLINTRNSTIPKGLVPSLVDKAYVNGYKVTFEEGFVDPFKRAIPFFPQDYSLPDGIEPRDYQIQSVERFLEKKRQMILSPTASGKSLTIYFMVRELQNLVDGRILIMVPRVSLVHQLHSDFGEYSVNDTWDHEEHVMAARDQPDRDTEHQVLISTWQGMQKRPAKWFEQFDAIIADEVHSYEAEVGSKIIAKCVNAFYRVGLTGTLKDAKSHELALTGSFGPAWQAISTKDLIDSDILARLEIKQILLRHKDTGPIKSDTPYQDEINFLVSSAKRNNWISKLTDNLDGNTLILFNLVEKHGKPLYEQIKEECPDKRVYFVYGGTDAEQREQIRKLVDKNEHVKVTLDFGEFSMKLNRDTKVPLSDGTTILAEEITDEHDISDEWLAKYREALNEL